MFHRLFVFAYLGSWSHQISLTFLIQAVWTMGWSDDPGGVQWDASSVRSPQHVLYVNTAVIAQVNPSLWHIVGMCRHILKCVDQQCWLSPRSTGFLQKRCDTEMCIYIYLPRSCNGINISCFSEPAFSGVHIYIPPNRLQQKTCTSFNWSFTSVLS